MATRYVETLRVRVGVVPDDMKREDVADALVGAFDVGDEFDVDELSDELQAWIVRNGGGPYSVETRYSVAQVGATGIGSEIVIWFLGAGGAIALHEVWEYLKGRVPRGNDAVRKEFQWLRQLDAAEVPGYLAGTLAQALDARKAELQPVEIEAGDDEISGTFETSTGERYRIRATEEVFEIARVDGEDGGSNA